MGERSVGFFTANGAGPYDVCELCTNRAHRFGLRPTPVSTDELRRRKRGRGPARAVEVTLSAARALGQKLSKLMSRRTRAIAPEALMLSAMPMGAAAVPLAITRFNESEHARMLAGLYKTLGAPKVSAVPRSATDREVVLTVAWDIVWYQFRISLDAIEANRGTYLSDLPTRWQTWNCAVSPDGRVDLVAEDVAQAAPARPNEPARS
jgi:hypothetical protein